jgi:sensor domain CHASE-containing protein
MATADQREWENMELQRDVAFKIMYFFIVFIIATFGLLYTYFKMSQKAEEDARREEA